MSHTYQCRPLYGSVQTVPLPRRFEGVSATAATNPRSVAVGFGGAPLYCAAVRYAAVWVLVAQTTTPSGVAAAGVRISPLWSDLPAAQYSTANADAVYLPPGAWRLIMPESVKGFFVQATAAGGTVGVTIWPEGDVPEGSWPSEGPTNG